MKTNRICRGALSLLLILVMVLVSMPAQGALSLRMGDINSDGEINASDALLALQHSVKLCRLDEAGLSMGDVTADSRIDSQDALNILQYSVKLITGFVNQGDGKINWELYYGIDGEDMDELIKINDINDADEVLDKLNQTPEASDVTTYQIDDWGYLIYDPISREAEKTGQITKYNASSKLTGSVTTDGVTVNYSIPGNVTAYDAIPIEYSIEGYGSSYPLYIEATAYGEEERDGDYYDLSLPGEINLSFQYDGYVSGSYNEDLRPELSGKTEDKQGTAYPSYEATDVISSGTLPLADLIWLKFTYTNTGNTILDGEGTGAFCIEPVLYKKDSNGEWTTNDKFTTNNKYEQLFDYLYPGESGEIYVQFQQQSLSSGEYKVVLYGKAMSEGSENNWNTTFAGGKHVTSSTFEFTVAKSTTPDITEPNPVQNNEVPSSMSRATYLRTYEEFMTSFEAIVDSDGTKGTMYLQCAPWTEYVTLRVMTGNHDNMELVRIPIKVESDSIQLYLNEEHTNYVVTEDCTREPIVMTQSMADMRANAQRGPDAASYIVNDLKDMQEAGINFISSTMAFGYDEPTSGASNPMPYESNKFMMDVARTLGMNVECYSSYPYEWAGLYSPNVSNVTAPYRGFGDLEINTANAVLANYTFQRYADMLYQAGDGTIPVATEDTRGWLRIDYSGIYDFSDLTQTNFLEWLRGKYSTIEELNAAYGSNYSSFDAINIESEASATNQGAGYSDSMMTFFNSDSVFHDWSRAILDLDIFRTVQRTRDYSDMIAKIPTTTPPKNTTDTVINPQVMIRTEANPYVSPSIDPTTDNAHYRIVYYAQRRNATVGEILAASDSVQGHSEYITIPFSPSEVYELVNRSTEAGLVEYTMPIFSGMCDIVINDTYGIEKYVQDLNLADTSLKAAYIRTNAALFPWFKATYAAGGVPGILWQDYISSSICTSTQYKELKFFKQKMQEMLSTDEGKAWATNFEQPDQSWRETTATAWSYPQEYMENIVNQTPRKCVFEGIYQ